MDDPSLHHHAIDGFAAITLSTANVSVTVVPALGARIVSLRRNSAGREWMWRPAKGRGLFACEPGTVFEHSPLIGADECIPSVLPCTIDGVEIPDHGEVWSRRWEVNSAAAAQGVIETSIALKTLPLTITRRLSAKGNAVRLEYRLENTGARSVRYLWAFHPMFTWDAGDEIDLGGTSNVTITGVKNAAIPVGLAGPWPGLGKGLSLNRGDYGGTDDSFCKGFLATRNAPTLSLVNRGRTERLTLEVDPLEVPAWGYWVSRGGWDGHTHWAMEPTNAPVDAPDQISSDSPATVIQRGETRTWSVTLSLSRKT
ncbi:MAG: hypothetical protein JWM32_1984 [Verrucomicrobia bacterium]|nr:hypothetical protein [Verrucomicrobiota bacterium]